MKHIIYIILTALLFLSACTEKIDFELNDGENNRLVVDGGITNETKVHSIRLTRSVNYLSNEEVPAVTGAEVTVSGGGEIFHFYDEDMDGIYQTDTEVSGKPGNTYMLNILLENNEEYTAECFMDSIENIDSLLYMYEEVLGFEDDEPVMTYFYKIFLFAQEPASTGDYYMWDLFIDNELDSDTLNEKIFTDDTEVNGNYIGFFDVFWIPDEKITQEITPVSVRMMSISKDQFEHHLALMLETDWKGGPFESPPANVPTNISNGALGFFYANAVSFSSIDVLLKSNVFF